MARVISTKSQHLYVKDRPFKKIYDRECSEETWNNERVETVEKNLGI